MIALAASSTILVHSFLWAGGIFLLGVVLAVVVWFAFAKEVDELWPPFTIFGLFAVLAIIGFFVAQGVGGFNETFKRERGRGDAPRTALDYIDRRPADWVVNFPDGYGNVATKCVGDGLRGFITSKASGASDLEILPDAACDGYSPGGDR